MLEAARKMELLAPAGSPEALDAAIGEGADAVYLGLKNFNARMRSANFTYAQFESALRSLRRMGKKIYVTVNTVFEQREADRMYQFLKYLAAVGPDALIVQDFGVVAMVNSEFPSLRLHASTQMNIASGRGANALSRYGVSRVVLARELCLEELRSIRTETNLEMEVFVHGALCVSASGLCLFSSYLGGKSANRGMCTQACRRLYSPAGNIKSGYFFSPGDLQLLENLPDLASAGVNALKIEGRMKSAEYVGAVVSAYRLVVDATAEGNEEKIQESIQQGQEILRNDFARPKTRFYFNDQEASPQSWLNPDQDGGTGIPLGAILKMKGSGDECFALVSPEGFIPAPGDSVRIHCSDDSARVSHKLTFSESDSKNGFWISVPEGFSPGDRVYLIQTKTMSKRYAPVIARNASGRGPGREKAPFPKFKELRNEEAGSRSKKSDPFPEGLYVRVSRPEDLYIVQSLRPARVILSCTRKNIAYLLADNKTPLPFKPAEIILLLDPYFPQSGQITPDEISLLIEKGYRQYILNNPGHFSLFRNSREVTLIAGPWLYIFNSWSLSFVASMGAAGFISPFENNRQNLDRILGRDSHPQAARLRSRFFIIVFAWPPLFRIRTNLGPAYKFDSFTDNRNEVFSLINSPEGSNVYPEKPFSITDKIPFLKEAGFSRFIIDLSGHSFKKPFYKDLMRAIQEGRPLPDITRFNWKDGFFQNKE
jgi:putative protease